MPFLHTVLCVSTPELDISFPTPSTEKMELPGYTILFLALAADDGNDRIDIDTCNDGRRNLLPRKYLFANTLVS